MTISPGARPPGLDRSLGCFLTLTLGLVALFGLLAILLLFRLIPMFGS